MSSITYTGVYPTIVNASTTVGGGGRAGMIATGSTRWNQTTSKMEMFDGYQWVAVSAGDIHAVTLAEMVENAEDQIGAQIEQDYADNVTIQDAFKAWEEANERFRVILSLSEKNK